MIRFIICGWHMNQDTVLNGFNTLQEYNPDNVHVFWSCHKEPTDFIKENFDYKVFPNGGEEYGAYEQAINYLDIDDEDVCFFMHDDLVIKDFKFIKIVVDTLTLDGYKIMGNGANYLVQNYDYNKVIDVGIKEEFDGMRAVDYVKEENRHIFNKPIKNLISVRPSFLAMQYKTVKEIGGFEPRYDAYVSAELVNEETSEYGYRGGKGLSSWGNEFPNLNNYKYNRLFDYNQVGFLSTKYLRSDWIYECARGKILDNYENLEESQTDFYRGNDLKKIMGRDS